jgi:ABC-2 type transport system ATP-binding protein
MDTVERLCDSICLINHGQVVLEGTLRGIKAGLRRKRRIAAIVDRPPNCFSQVAAQYRLNKFELVEPSLEKIFIDSVGKQNG